MEINNNIYTNYQSTVTSTTSKGTQTTTTKESPNDSAISVSIGENKYSYDDLLNVADHFANNTIYSSENGFNADTFAKIANDYVNTQKFLKNTSANEEDYGNLMKALDEAYSKSANSMAAKVTGQLKVAANALADINRVQEAIDEANKTGSHRINVVGKMNNEEEKELKSLCATIEDSVKNLSDLAKKYALDGNNLPTTDEEKEKFKQYLDENIDEDTLSIDDLSEMGHSAKDFAKKGFMVARELFNSFVYSNKDDFDLDAERKVENAHKLNLHDIFLNAMGSELPKINDIEDIKDKNEIIENTPIEQ